MFHSFLKRWDVSLQVALLATYQTIGAAGVPYPQTIPHDQVQPILTAVDPASLLGRYAPLLAIDFSKDSQQFTGCHPYPAVNEKGEISAGLNVGGTVFGECGKVTGQVYSRTYTYGDGSGSSIMYAWFFPKTQQNHLTQDNGHKYAWTWVVIDFTPQSVAYQMRLFQNDNTRQVIHPTWPQVRDHPSLIKTYTNLEPNNANDGDMYPIADWDQIGIAARQSLNDFNFGSDPNQACPFNEANFENNILEVAQGHRAISRKAQQ